MVSRSVRRVGGRKSALSSFRVGGRRKSLRSKKRGGSINWTAINAKNKALAKAKKLNNNPQAIKRKKRGTIRAQRVLQAKRSPIYKRLSDEQQNGWLRYLRKDVKNVGLPPKLKANYRQIMRRTPTL
jgi:hypothetical protein